jgi:hypothetical protein
MFAHRRFDVVSLSLVGRGEEGGLSPHAVTAHPNPSLPVDAAEGSLVRSFGLRPVKHFELLLFEKEGGKGGSE